MSRSRPTVALSALAAGVLGVGLIAAVAPPAAAVGCTPVTITASAPALPDDVAAGEVYCLDVADVVGSGTVTAAADLAWSDGTTGTVDLMSGYDADAKVLTWTVMGRPEKWQSSIRLEVDGTPTAIGYSWVAPTLGGQPAFEVFRSDGNPAYPNSRPSQDGGWWNDALIVMGAYPTDVAAGSAPTTVPLQVACSDPGYDPGTGASNVVVKLWDLTSSTYLWPEYVPTSSVPWMWGTLTDTATETVDGSWAQTGSHWTWTGTATIPVPTDLGYHTLAVWSYGASCNGGGIFTYTPGINVVDPHGVADTASTHAEQPVTVNVLSNDPGGSVLDAVTVDPGHGTAVIDGSSIVYTPEPGFLGTDTFSYSLVGVDGDVVVTVEVTQAPPGAPGDLQISGVTASSAHLSWTAPAEVGAGIAGYVVWISPSGEDAWEPAVDTASLEATVNGLAPATEYDVEVVAVAEDEQESEAAAGSFTTAAGSVPDVPTQTVSTGGTVDVTVPGLDEVASLSVPEPAEGVASVSVDGNRVSIVTEAGFTGIIDQAVVVDQGGAQTTVHITVVVNPAAPSARSFAIAGHGMSTIRWTGARGATAYVVTLRGHEVCRTAAAGRSCTVARLLGPASVVKVRALGNATTRSSAVAATYRRPATAPVVASIGFGTGDLALDAGDKRQVRLLAERIARNGFRTVLVDGYSAAATTGPAAEAAQLRASMLRAKAVATALTARLRALGSTATVTVRWHGADHPVASNLAFNGRIENRRADISVR